LNNFRHNAPQSIGAFLPKIKEPAMSEAREYTKFIPQELKGRITHNKYKQKDTDPDLKGTLCVKGQIVNFGIWKNDGPHGEYFNIKVSDPDWKDKQKDAQYPKEITPKSKMAGDIPW